jgi:large subunit ribosomal protein L13
MKKINTYSLKAGEIEKAWHVVDATDQTLGRVATRVATLLMGKHKATYSPHLDMGDFVVVVNASRIRVTGNKLEDKIYYRHTGYVGGLKETPLKTMLEKHPDRVLEKAVKGMLPRNTLAKAQLKHLKVYPGAEHPHGAQVAASSKAQKNYVPAPMAALASAKESR